MSRRHLENDPSGSKLREIIDCFLKWNKRGKNFSFFIISKEPHFPLIFISATAFIFYNLNLYLKLCDNAFTIILVINKPVDKEEYYLLLGGRQLKYRDKALLDISSVTAGYWLRKKRRVKLFI